MRLSGKEAICGAEGSLHGSWVTQKSVDKNSYKWLCDMSHTFAMMLVQMTGSDMPALARTQIYGLQKHFILNVDMASTPRARDWPGQRWLMRMLVYRRQLPMWKHKSDLLDISLRKF